MSANSQATVRTLVPQRLAAVLLAMLTLSVAQPALAVEAPAARAAFRQVEMADVIAAAQPAVVKIDVTKTVGSIARLDGRPMPDFLRRFGIPGQAEPQRRAEGVGSGFIIDQAGHVVTNNHVIDGAQTMTVTLHDGRTLPAKLIGSDPLTDLALLRIEDAKQLPVIEFGDSDSARVGDWVVAIGSPFGFGGSVTAGIISARGRDIRSGPYDDFLQIDAPINSGNSGGPVLDATGKVIGVNTAIFSPTGGNVGIGFAIPAAEARRVVAELRDHGQVTRGWLGVQIQEITVDVAAALGLDEARGALVAVVVDKGPAARAGVRTGDVIVSFGDTAVHTPRDLSRAVARSTPGSKVPFAIRRDGREQRLVTVIDRNAEAGLAALPDDGASSTAKPLESFGLALGPISADLRQQMNLDATIQGAMVVGIKDGGSADLSGVRPGDVIVQVNRKVTDDAAQAEQALLAARSTERPIVVLIRRGPEQFFTTIKVA